MTTVENNPVFTEVQVAALGPGEISKSAKQELGFLTELAVGQAVTVTNIRAYNQPLFHCYHEGFGNNSVDSVMIVKWQFEGATSSGERSVWVNDHNKPITVPTDIELGKRAESRIDKAPAIPPILGARATADELAAAMNKWLEPLASRQLENHDH